MPVTLWHFLSKDRLLQKIEHAQSRSGQLLLHPPEEAKDITKGKLAHYIYCLPSILSGMNFSDKEKMEAVKITLKPEARIFRFTGDPRELDYTELNKNFDAVDMTVSASGFSQIRFRQILLMHHSAIERWEHSLSVDFTAELDQDWKQVQNLKFPQTEFFMIDLTPEEILSACRLSAVSLGLKQFPEQILKADENTIFTGLKRLGAI